MPNLRNLFGFGLRAVAALVTAAVLAGCAQIPLNGDVQVGPEVSQSDNYDYVYFNPAPPQLGQTPSQIINGFLSAGTGTQNDYSVARQYLSIDFRPKWNPSNEVIVQSGLPQVDVISDKRVLVTVDVQARVDSDGNYESYDKSKKRKLDFDLVKENGSWRISNAPDMTLLVRPVFDSIFSAYTLYFFDNAHQYLVPDLRWFPARASTGTRMVNALLKGPSKWLNAAASTPMPAGTKLAIDAVTVSQGKAKVNLDAKALKSSTNQIRMFKAQLNSTLKQLPNVSSVQLMIDGNERVFQDFVPESANPETTSPVILSDGKLRFANQSVGVQLQSAQRLIAKAAAFDFAIKPNRREVALLGKDGMVWAKLGQIGGDLTLLDSRPNLLAPVFDHSGLIWSVTKDLGSQLLAIGKDGQQRVVVADWLANYSVKSFAISPEGSRIAMVVAGQERKRVLVAAVVRDENGVPVALAEPINQTVPGLTPISITWLGESTVLGLYSSKSIDGTLPYRTTIGGQSTSFGNAPRAKSVAASNGGRYSFLLTENHKLYTYSGYTWNLVAESVVAAHMAE